MMKSGRLRGASRLWWARIVSWCDIFLMGGCVVWLFLSGSEGVE